MSEEVFRYERLASRIARQIESGTIRPGERVPSVRRLSRESGVSISTVLQAYLRLERDGLIEARPQSGFYARVNPRRLPPEPRASSPLGSAATVPVSDLAVRMMQAVRDPELVPLGAACPSPELFPAAALHRAQTAVLRRLGPRVHHYDVAPGIHDLRRQIAKRSIDAGCAFSADEIVITSGCIDALNLCLRAVASRGDIVAVESPTYFGILSLLEVLGLRALEVPTHPRDGVDLSALQTALKKHRVAACVFMTNFHNPMGSCMPDEAKKDLVTLLAKQEIPLIEDDIYGDLPFGSRRPIAAKSLDRKGLVLWCGSFSKILAPGYRIGWTAPGRFYKQVERLKMMTSIGSGTLPQLVLAEFLQRSSYDRYLRKIRSAYRSQVQRLAQAVGKYFPAGTSVTRPAGGFVLWLELPKHVDSVRLYEQALERKISIAPGPIFTTKKRFRNCIRLNCGLIWSDQLDHALFTLGQLASS